MSTKNLIARDDEIHRLDRCLRETNAQLVILYGRRRVGKTFLINEYFEGRFDFKITGTYGGKKDVQLRYFAEELSNQTKSEQKTPKDWIEAFSMLRTYISSLPDGEKHIVFFDEMPWLDTQRSGFLSAFEHFWNDYGCAVHNLVMIVCGSATSWMTKKIANNKGGLFDRQTCSIYLRPFTLRETEKYLKTRGIEWSRYDIAECYMVIGGIPYYLSLLNPEKSLAGNIDNLFFRKRAELWNEFDQLYKTLFTNSLNYVKIVEALSTKKRGLTRKEIIGITGLPDNGDFSEMLENLISSDFVRAYSFFGKEKKDTVYQLKDYYSLFYFKFIKGYRGRDEEYWSHSYGSPAKNAWAGLTFEQVCKDHVQEIRRALGIAGVQADVSSWNMKGNDEQKGAQIDLLVDRRDHVVDICEIKYSEKKFTIDKEYDRTLRNKRETFREATGTGKTLQIVLITTYGVRQNKYSGIVSSQVVLDDLFE